MYITYNAVSIPTRWAVAGPHRQLASLKMPSGGRAQIENVMEWAIFMFSLSALPPAGGFEMSTRFSIYGQLVKRTTFRYFKDS